MKTSRLSKTFLRIKHAWRPQKLEKPLVDPLFPEMDAVERSAETSRYSILSTEFWISPDGQVREWIRHNTRAIVLFIPVLVLIALIGLGLSQVAAWTVALTIIAGHLIIVPVLVLLVVLVVLAIIKLLKSLFS